jgi:hypothetical protein
MALLATPHFVDSEFLVLIVFPTVIMGGLPRGAGTERDLVRVATFNINNINKRLDNPLSWLAKAEPDVVSRPNASSTTGHSADPNRSGGLIVNARK